MLFLHLPCCFSAHQKVPTDIGGIYPHKVVDIDLKTDLPDAKIGGIQYKGIQQISVCSDVVKYCLDLVFVKRCGLIGISLGEHAVFLMQLFRRRVRLFPIAASDEDVVPLPREAPCDGEARSVVRARHKNRFFHKRFSFFITNPRRCRPQNTDGALSICRRRAFP